MRFGKNNLSKQLLFVVGVAFLLLFISLGAILPRLLIPVAESNIYNYLREPLKIYDNDADIKIEDTEIAYIYVSDNNIAIWIRQVLIPGITDDEEDLLKLKVQIMPMLSTNF